MDTKFNFSLTRDDQERVLKTKGHVYWLFGLSGCGKSTIANKLQKILNQESKFSILLDGDNVREGLCSDLDYSLADRKENLRRIAELAKIQSNNGVTTLCCFITPLLSHRKMIQNILGDFVDFIFINTSIEECEKRDPKGLYKKARSGEIQEFSGISSPFEGLNESEVGAIINTEDRDLDEVILDLKSLLK
jgi:adenylyl-sulfate kinase